MPSIKFGSSKPGGDLTPKKRALLAYLALPGTLLALVVGSLGLVVLLDDAGTSPLSQSTFGYLYKKLIKFNPFFAAFIFNVGLIGSIYIVALLTGATKGKIPSPPGKQQAEAKKDK